MTAYEQIEALVDAYAGIHCAPTDLECIAAATAAHAALLAAVKALAEDAERYRWLVSEVENPDSAWCVYRLGNELPARLDEAIDAARQSTVSAPAEPK